MAATANNSVLDRMDLADMLVEIDVLSEVAGMKMWCFEKQAANDFPTNHFGAIGSMLIAQIK